jgi:hypothetical protein
MRRRHVRNRLDFGHSKYSKICLPLVESVQRVMVRAQVFGQTVSTDRSLEHAAQRCAVKDAAVDAKAHEPPAELVHHDQNPMRSQRGGLAAEQIATPQAVFRLSEESQPGGTSAIRFRPVMLSQDTANHVLVEFDTKRQGDLLSDSGTSPTRIPPFHFDDGIDEFFLRPFPSWTTPALWRKQ